jgi:hypothetical protein
MSHAAFHLAEEYISEDLVYYFSGERDKNNQIRPDENIYSMTPTSSCLSHSLNNAQVSNFFFPCLPNHFDRIYIGISVPLFANNWGTSFLLQLLTILKPGGAIIMPVYPETQAQDKGYWSRSFLENAFISRQRWTGFSNVRAENDGVMSLQVGRKWPDPIPSTAEWFYQQRSNLILQEVIRPEDNTASDADIKTIYSGLVEKVWKNYTHSAVVERIIFDYLGAKMPVSFHNISNDYGLLLTELLLSTHINIINGITTDTGKTVKNISNNFNSYFAPHTGNRHKIETATTTQISIHQGSNVISMINVLSELKHADRVIMLREAWQKLTPGGVLIVYEDLKTDLYDVLGIFGEVHTYSSIVASKIQLDIDISHYSSIQQSNLIKEKHDQGRVFLTVQKNDTPG